MCVLAACSKNPSSSQTAQPAASSAPSAATTAAAKPGVPGGTEAERLAAAQDLIRAMTYRDTLIAVLEQQKTQIADRIKGATAPLANGKVKPEELAALRKNMVDTYWNAIKPDDLVNQYTEVYAHIFTVDELNGMAEFYRTAAGKALVKHTQDVSKKIGEIFGPRMQAAVMAAQKVERDFMAAHPNAMARPSGPMLPPGLHYTPPPKAGTNPTPTVVVPPAAPSK